MKHMLSKEQMKSIQGGYSSSSAGTCHIEVTCNSGTKIGCGGSGSNCHKSDHEWVQCDDDPKVTC